MATTRRYLELNSSLSSTLLDGDVSATPININCLDPLGRSALLIGSPRWYSFPFCSTVVFFSLAIEYENLEMIELLLSYNIDTGEALLFAIDEQFVEGKWSSSF